MGSKGQGAVAKLLAKQKRTAMRAKYGTYIPAIERIRKAKSHHELVGDVPLELPKSTTPKYVKRSPLPFKDGAKVTGWGKYRHYA